MRALTVSALSDDRSGVALIETDPAPRGAGQVRVAVRAAALNHPDLLMTRGTYQLKPPLPFVPGMEVAGTVIEADAGDGFAVGERVVCATRLGGLADQAVCDANYVRRIPAGIDDVAAAAIGAAYLTAQVALVALAGIEAGDWVVVHGASGGVGMAAVDLAMAHGARVIATSRSADKLRLVDEAYGPAATLTTPGFREAVRDLTGGGADIVFDPVGGDTFDESTRCIGFGGRLLVVGFTSGRIASVATNIALIKGFSIVGVRAGEYGRRFPAAGRAAADAVWRLAAEGRIRPHIDSVHPLADWGTAFARMAASDHVGKIVLVP